MDDREILKCLEENSEGNKVVLDFTKKIFKAEFMGISNWKKYYDDQIKEFGGKLK